MFRGCSLTALSSSLGARLHRITKVASGYDEIAKVNTPYSLLIMSIQDFSVL